MAGFFEPSILAQHKAPIAQTARCGACKLHKACQSPKIPVQGNGSRGIMIVMSAVTKADDDMGQFARGDSGRLLRNIFSELGDLDIDEDCWTTGALICNSPEYPNAIQIEHCAPNLRKAILEKQPSLIIPLGSAANRAVLQLCWSDDIGPFDRWSGFQVPVRPWNAWVCPTWSVSEVHREKKQRAQMEFWWRTHLMRAFDTGRERPWEIDTVPTERSQVEQVLDPDNASEIIHKMADKGGPCAFDYETTCLKPESPHAKIVSCSICWRGRKTIAYPWTRATAEATSYFLRSDCPKIASNLQFEERWTLKHLGHPVNNWAWDTMVNGHLQDTRLGITSIKFQGFLRRGLDAYNGHIAPFLVADGTMDKNRIREIALSDLLLYNGLDSVVEYDVAQIQSREMGIDLWTNW